MPVSGIAVLAVAGLLLFVGFLASMKSQKPAMPASGYNGRKEPMDELNDDFMGGTYRLSHDQVVDMNRADREKHGG